MTMFLVVTTVIMATLCTIVFVLLYNRTKRKYTENMRLAGLKSDYDQSLATAKMEMTEVAFQQISSEIHDNIKNRLTLSKRSLHSLKEVSESDKQHVDDAVKHLAKAIRDLSHLSKTLSAQQIVRDGLLNVLEREVNELDTKGWFRIEMQIIGKEVLMSAEREVLIFRIVQEALGNILVHARPKHINILLEYLADRLELTIADDGKGFEESIENQQQGSGLTNMKERARILNGTLNIKSVPGSGTTLQLSVPYK
jgi:signal transduction histidine kinase